MDTKRILPEVRSSSNNFSACKVTNDELIEILSFLLTRETTVIPPRCFRLLSSMPSSKIKQSMSINETCLFLNSSLQLCYIITTPNKEFVEENISSFLCYSQQKFFIELFKNPILVNKTIGACDKLLTEQESVELRLISALINKNNHYYPKLTDFDSTIIPPQSIKEWLRHLMARSPYSSGAYIVMYLILDTYRQHNPTIGLHCYNIHRLVLVSLHIAHKFIDDDPLSNFNFATFIGITIQEFNMLELALLKAIQFNIYSTKKYDDVVKKIVATHSHLNGPFLNSPIPCHSPKTPERKTMFTSQKTQKQSSFLPPITSITDLSYLLEDSDEEDDEINLPPFCSIS